MIQIRTFYLIGTILMVFSIVGSIWNAAIIWPGLNNGGKMSTVTGVLFNVLWMSLFLYLYKVTPKSNPQIVDNKEIEDLLKELDMKGGSYGQTDNIQNTNKKRS